MGISYFIEFKFSLGRIASGNNLEFSLDTNFPPIWLNGLITLAIGLFLKESSPVKVTKKFCGASIPINNLKVVPEFPASNTFSCSFSPSIPTP